MCQYEGRIVKCSDLLEAEVRLVKTIDKKEEKQVLDFIKTHLRQVVTRSLKDRDIGVQYPNTFKK